LEEFVATVAPHFAYQLQLKSGDLEPVIRTEDDIKKFLSALYGGRTEKGEVAFDAGLGILLDKIFEVQPSKLLSEEVGFPSSMFSCLSTNSREPQELDYYAKEFSRTGIRGPRKTSGIWWK
jgi:hypothetical protein